MARSMPLRSLVAPAKAGAHFSGITLVEAWTPTFAGVTDRGDAGERQ